MKQQVVAREMVGKAYFHTGNGKRVTVDDIIMDSTWLHVRETGNESKAYWVQLSTLKAIGA